MFLLMTDGAWHCQGTVGQACASSMPPAPLLCTPPHKLKHTHTPSLSHLAYLSWTLVHCSPTFYPHLLCVCLSFSQSLFLVLSLTHTLARHSFSSAHCEDDCLWTDIYDTGRMCWINCVSIGIDPINRQNRNVCFMTMIQDEKINKLFCCEMSAAASWWAL